MSDHPLKSETLVIAIAALVAFLGFCYIRSMSPYRINGFDASAMLFFMAIVALATHPKKT